MTLLTRRFNLSLVHMVPEDCAAGSARQLHGHDFKLDVTLKGEPDETTGEIMAREELDGLVRDCILSRYDKTLINNAFAHGTGEFLAREFLRLLRTTKGGDAFVAVQLVETRKNRFQCVAAEG